jgi:predicted 2-oxoglutarate/Fe(II)-dependent dioxygenase YbiX
MNEGNAPVPPASAFGRLVGPGEPLPWFKAATAANPSYMIDTVGGRHIVLSFPGPLRAPPGRALLDFVAGPGGPAFDDSNIAFFGVLTDPADLDEGRAVDRVPGIRWFRDFEGGLSRHFGVDGTAAAFHTLVVDPTMRVLARFHFDDPEAHNAALGAMLQGLAPVASDEWSLGNAPVLLIPRILEPEMCRRLVDLYETQGGSESGFMTSRDGRSVGTFDASRKRRSDCMIEDQDLCRGLAQRITRRLVPMIERTMNFRPTRIERYVVACYDGEQRGFFTAHRDNTTPATRHRRFAVTINLNAEQYEGGDLRFPEFGRQTYRAPTGGAVVFSCSLLHEALPVTRGRRYAFLPFLYDDAAAQVRDETRSLIVSAEKPDPAAG